MTTHIKFSPQPGAYERHLQRKYHNPLFATAEQHLLASEVEQARMRDQQDLRGFLEAFEQSVQQAARLDESVESEVLLDLKENLERLYVQSASLAGDLEQYQQALHKLIEVCMLSIRRGAQNDPSALHKLDEEKQAREVYFQLLRTPLVADLMRGEEIISAQDLVPSLLSESESALADCLNLFDEQQQQQLLELAERLIQEQPETASAATYQLRLRQMRSLIAANSA